MSITEAGGWCAPSQDVLDMWAFEVEPERWPPGLTGEDLDWLAAMLHVGEIDVSGPWWELPSISIRRGGIQFPQYPVDGR